MQSPASDRKFAAIIAIIVGLGAWGLFLILGSDFDIPGFGSDSTETARKRPQPFTEKALSIPLSPDKWTKSILVDHRHRGCLWWDTIPTGTPDPIAEATDRQNGEWMPMYEFEGLRRQGQQPFVIKYMRFKQAPGGESTMLFEYVYGKSCPS